MHIDLAIFPGYIEKDQIIVNGNYNRYTNSGIR